MNDTQKRILAYIIQYKQEKGFAPTVAEIGVFANMAAPSALYNLQRLEAFGVIKRTNGVRGIQTEEGEISYTAKQTEVLRAIRDLRAEAIKVTLDSLAKRLSLSAVTVREHLIRLEQKGVVARNPIQIVTQQTQPAPEQIPA
jgi:Mn-dependent DtxR family transcriptional regulator